MIGDERTDRRGRWPQVVAQPVDIVGVPRGGGVRIRIAAGDHRDPLVVPPLPPPAEGSAKATAPSTQRPATHRSGYRPWAELMKRTFATDVDRCGGCGGRLKLVRFVTRRQAIEQKDPSRRLS